MSKDSQLAGFMAVKKLIALLSIQDSSSICSRENQSCYLSLQKAFSKHSFNLPSEEDFCRTLTTLKKLNILITQTNNTLEREQINKMAKIIAEKFCPDALWITNAFSFLVEVLQKDGYSFSYQ